jgi:hypothetical protein
MRLGEVEQDGLLIGDGRAPLAMNASRAVWPRTVALRE